MTCILPGSLGLLGGVAGPSTWDPAHKNAYVTLSNNNLTATGNNSGFIGTVRGVHGRSSGKYYFELTLAAFAFGFGTTIGALNSAYTIDASGNLQIGQDSAGNSAGMFPQGALYYLVFMGGAVYTQSSPPVNGDVITVALDLTAGNGYYGLNGYYLGADPAAGTGALVAWTPGQTWFPAASVGNTTNVCILNVGKTAFTYAVPAGYAAWL
jgi:hypothetical protein